MDDNQKTPLLIDAAGLSSFSVDSLLSGMTTDFDIYLRVSNGFTLYAAAPYKWDIEELKRLLVQGYALLYYSTTDQEKYERCFQVGAFKKIDQKLPPHRRIIEITEVGMEFTKFLYEQPLTAAALEKGKEVASLMISCVREDPSCVSALGLLANHDYYTYYHSARVAAYAIAISIQMGMTSEDCLSEVALGCLLHDIGKSKIDLLILNKPGALTDKEMNEMKTHPEKGHLIVEPSILSSVPREIILHHHERIDGGGYPHGINKNELLQEVRIAAFADIFDALTTNRPYQKSRTKFEAMDLIKNRLLKGLDPDVFRAMIALLNKK